MNKPIRLLLACGSVCLAPLIADAADFTCTGTEPFWKLEIKDSGVLLQDGNKVSGQSKLALKSVKPRLASTLPPQKMGTLREKKVLTP